MCWRCCWRGVPWPAKRVGMVADSLRIFLYRLIDFGITFGALYFLLRGPLKRALGARRQRLVNELEQARQMQASAESRYAACQQQLADADAQIAKLTAAAAG